MQSPEPPLLLTAALDAASTLRLQSLRDRFFPPERNVVPAHVSILHKLPGDDAGLAQVVAFLERKVLIDVSPVRFGRLHLAGACLQIIVEDAPVLASTHAALVREFGPLLTRQDQQPYRPHVTIMNKAPRVDALQAFASLSPGWEPWVGDFVGVDVWRYLGGPWAHVVRVGKS